MLFCGWKLRFLSNKFVFVKNSLYYHNWPWLPTLLLYSPSTFCLKQAPYSCPKGHLGTWTTKLAIANNQVIGPFGGNSLLKSARMARSFPRICVEDEIFSLWSYFDVDWSTGQQPTPIVVLLCGILPFPGVPWISR